MCLGIPMVLVEEHGFLGTAEVDGVRREVSLMLLPEPARVGDHVLVHAGYAISSIDPEEAAASLALLRDLVGGDVLEWGEERS